MSVPFPSEAQGGAGFAPNGTSNGNSNGISDVESSPSSPIAIIGMSCKFGGDATSPSKLWDLCKTGKDSWSPIPAKRFDVKSLYHPEQQRAGRHHVKGGYFMEEDVALFDAAFFNLSADVSAAMDPQLRLLMESVYVAIENAGIPIEKLSGTDASVFAGTFGRDYFDTQIRDSEVMPTSFMTGNGIAMFSNRISHFYDFKGASMTIDTGCSTSMVALHQGIKSIQSGESNVSIVASACAILNPDMFIAMSNMNVLDPNGRCYSWDHRSGGYGRGEGVATLVLKRLDAALQDGDFVHAVIRESALNQDGKTTTISSPSMEAQEQLIKECYRRAGLDISQTGYVEAHMTGTASGDPIEAEALARTFGKPRDIDDPVIVGSVKTNIGHTEPVSGLASIIKTVFALREGVIPPNLNYEKTNPKIPLKEWKLRVPTALTPWPKDKPLRASVNNFGYGGSNAHIIMERAPKLVCTVATNNTAKPDASRVYIISSKDSTVTQTMNKALAVYIRQSIANGTEPLPADLAYTLAERKSRFHWATAVRAKSLAELADRLDDPDRKATRALRNPRIGFVFNGQGGQWYAMGRELIAAYPVFSSAIELADQILQEYGATWSLHEELLRGEKFTRVHEIELSQPVTVALQLCLVDLLKSWGITPTAVTSHSSGEIAAAYAVGALSFEEALGVVYYRGQLAFKHQNLSSHKGGMLAAGLSAEEAEKYLVDSPKGRVVVACINSANSVTLSGDLPALDEVASQLNNDGVFARMLKVPLAYHSHHMLNMAKEYNDSLSIILPKTRSWSGALFASPVTGDIVTSPKVLSPEHWVRNLTSPVRFSEAFENMCFSQKTSDGTSRPSNQGANVDLLVEIGAHGTLSGPIRQILKDRSIPYVSCLKRSVDAVETMQALACDLIVQGVPVSLEAVNSPLGNEKHAYVHDLPSYAWNHSTRYWVEPRIYREHRFKRFRPHELLGTPVSGANWLYPTWRNFLRISDVPWLTDHQLDSKVVLPGAGYVAMAIEAVRLLTDPSEETIQGYRLRDVDIMNALTIPSSSGGIETQLTLRACSDKELEHKGWYEFELSSVGAEDSWVQHCKGYVSAETVNASKSAMRSETRAPHSESFFTPGLKVENIDPESIFVGLRSMNFYHGPMFQNLIESRSTAKKAITKIGISTTALESCEDYVLHPTTLDSIIQACYVGIPEETKENSMVVPRSIGSMFVPRNLKRHKGDKLRVFTNLQKADRRGASSNAIIVNDDSHEETTSFLQIENFYFQGIPRADGDSTESNVIKMCARNKWELDILHAFPAALKDALRINLGDAEVDFEKRNMRASYHFIYEAVAELEGQESDSWQWYHKIFYGWMKTIVELGKSGKLAKGSESWPKASKGIKQRLIDNLAIENPAGKLTCRVGPKLASIIRGELTPLELMMDDNLLNQYYETLPSWKDRTFKHLRHVVELYAVKQPGAKVLEIGAGTGGATAIVLEGFGAKAEAGSGSLLGHYDFTDISSGFFGAAQQKFAAWGGLVDYKKLDIEEDPLKQSFVAGSYDLIVASAVLHATKSLKRTMTNVRSLLKPGGKLLLVENTQDSLAMQLIFGTLPGWWLSEEPDRKMSPNVSVQKWDEVLQATGFTGIDFEIADCEDPQFQSEGIILSTAKPESSYTSSISIVYSQNSPPQKWLNEVTKAIQAQIDVVPIIESLEHVKVKDDHVYIFTAEMTEPFVDNISSTDFEKLKNLLVNSLGVLWLSCSSAVDAKEPIYAQTQGLLRTMKQEDSNKRYIQLDFESTQDPWTVDKIQHIVHVLQQSFNYDIESIDIEWEYSVKNSMLYVPRIYPDQALDRASSETRVDPVPKLQPFWQADRALVWETPKSGVLNNLYFTDHPEITDDIPSGMVEIEPKAFGLNFRDVMVALGQLDETLIGHDFSGIIKRLGPNTEQSGLKVGDRVCGIGKGRFGSTDRALWTGVAKIPDEMSWEVAASIPFAYLTSYISFFDVARLEKGESVLIHAATGGVGQAALMLAQHAGAEIYVTCGTEEKRDLLIQKYGIDPDHIFSSRDASFAPAIMAKTNGKGVDVVLNSLAGPLLKASWNCISQFGRFVEIGKVDLEAARRLDLTPFSRSATMAGVDLLQLNEYKGKVVQNALINCIRLYHDQSIKAVFPITPYSITDMEKAMRQMQGGSHMGKLVLIPNPDDQVKVVSRPRPLSLDNSESTYMIAGGLGGIGNAIVQWMIKKGAKNILLVSRRAESHPDAATLCQNAKADGCNLHIRNCDVSNEASLVKLLADCASTIPPIRGVIQAAMHLDDTVLEHMSYEQWRHGILPKVPGTLNLHTHLHNLNFFIMLSSMTGILGNVSQSNYAAGNTFQDALARNRIVNGLPASVIDLGPVESVGYVAEADDSLRKRIEKTVGSNGISIDHMLRLLEGAIQDPLQKNPDDSQILTCISNYNNLPDDMQAKRDKRFGTLRLGNAEVVVSQDSTGDMSHLDELVLSLSNAAVTSAEATELVSATLVTKIGDLFNIAASEIDTGLPLSQHGVDSLIAVELRNWLSSAIKTKVSIFEILQSSSLTDFAALVATRSKLGIIKV